MAALPRDVHLQPASDAASALDGPQAKVRSRSRTIQRQARVAVSGAASAGEGQGATWRLHATLRGHPWSSRCSRPRQRVPTRPQLGAVIVEFEERSREMFERFKATGKPSRMDTTLGASTAKASVKLVKKEDPKKREKVVPSGKLTKA